MLNLNSGYGKLIANLLPSGFAGKIFVVAKSDAAGRQLLQEIFKVDNDGVNRYAATIDAAIGYTTASRGDVIFVAPGHTETVTAAAGIALDVAGVSVIGLGSGNTRPKITFSTATTASFDITADNCKVKNIIGIAGIDGLTKPFLVSGNNCEIDIEWQDASASIEAATAIRLDTADNAICNLKYLGFVAGNATVRAIAVDDCDNVRINVDFYGIVTTAVVNFVDVLSTNVHVTGRMYTSGTTNFSQTVVDTITSSIWTATFLDATANVYVSGGNVAALASDDVTAVASDLTTVKGNVGGVDSATNVLGADDADNQFASTNVAANRDGTVLERLEALMDPLGGYDPVLGFRVTKTSNLADGAGTDALFTVTGRCLITHLSGEVTTVIGGAATMKLTDTTNTVDLCAATTIDTDAVGTMYALPSLSAQILNGTGGTPVVGSVPNIAGIAYGAGQIIGDVQAPLTISHILDAADTGAVDWVLYYKPLTAASSIVAAA